VDFVPERKKKKPGSDYKIRKCLSDFQLLYKAARTGQMDRDIPTLKHAHSYCTSAF